MKPPNQAHFFSIIFFPIIFYIILSMTPTADSFAFQLELIASQLNIEGPHKAGFSTVLSH